MKQPHIQRFPWNLDWNLLRTFMVVVEQHGISKAADFLGLKQPTISAALKRLEQHTGQTLIIRKPNEFSVTRAGQVLYTECAKIFGSVSQLPALLNVAHAELRGHLSIATTSHVVSEHFDNILSEFNRFYPQVTFSFTVSESNEVETIVSQNRASFGICLLSETPKNLDTLVLYREYFGLYCGARHPLFNAPHIDPAALEGEAFVAFQTEAEGGPLEAISRLRIRLRLANSWRGVSSSLNEIRRMIMANIGIGALPLHVAKRDVDAGRLRQLPPYTDLPMVNIYVITNPERRFSDAEATFLSACAAKLSKIDIAERTYGA
ncbi:LysR family transcriptional regulator [Yoonia sediminilitoris]|uniref:DNA-binding transcriptional LysR family regulator n=1 Tax=Yoonia sediminilitoris TaxID=1286148 RepID=A0A2T6KCR6_9RHOB|nr:LysR family transcriptional regulator [Yoonia sediminilitoris]PUB12720.1 DNA-binding transcriptional LysR family regulator [Yoonia sediminilitoris]